MRGILIALASLLVVFVIVSFVVFDNYLALAPIGIFLFAALVRKRFRVYSIPVIFLLEFIVLAHGYGTNEFLGLRLGYVDIFLFLSTAFYFVENLAAERKDRVSLPGLSLIILWVLYCVTVLIVRNEELRLSMLMFQQIIIEPFMIIYVAINTIRNRADWNRVFALLACLLLIMNIEYAYSYYSVVESYTPSDIAVFSEIRADVAGMPYENKNVYGAILIMFLPVAVGYLISVRTIIMRGIMLALIGSSLMIINLLISRGAVISLTLSVVITLLMMPRNRVRHVLGVTAFLIIALIIAINTGTYELYVKRSQEIDVNRLELIWQSMRIIENNPIIGVGLNEKAFMDALTQGNLITMSGIYAHPHNSYLEIATYIGLPSLVIFLLFLRTSLSNLFSKVLSMRHDVLITGLKVGVLAFIIDMATDYVMFKFYSAHAFWIIFSMAIIYLSNLKKEENHELA